MNTPDGGVTDEPMPPDFARAYAEAYPDRVSDYVETQVWEAGKNSAARIAELEAENARLREALERFHAAHDDAQSGMSPIVHTAPSQSADLIAEAEAIAERLTTSLDATKALRDLAAALRAAEAENARLRNEVDETLDRMRFNKIDTHYAFTARVKQLEAENARLREALTGIQKGAEGYNNGVLQVVAETARRALGGEP